MKITNGKKQEYNYKNTYKIIYKQIKEEIKNIVIDKYIKQINSLFKQVEYLKKENSLLKNDLIYILKRVLLLKNDNNMNSQNINIHRIPQQRTINPNGLSNTSLLNNKSYNSVFSSGDTINTINYDNNYNHNYNNNYKYRNINNSIGKSPSELRGYSIDDDNKKGNISLSPLETSRQMNVNNKINFYLNSLYKHNFAEECASGTASIHLLNKNQSIYDELFVNINHKYKNKIIPNVNTEMNFKKVSNSKSKSKSNSKKKFILVEDNNIIRNKKNFDKNYKYQKNKTNDYLKVNKKVDTHNLKANYGNINRKTDSKTNININIKTYYKNTKISGSNLSSRSRFLVNKF